VALFAGDGDVLQQPALKVPNVVDTTGAGDCFTAAFTVALIRGRTRQEAMAFATRAAAYCIQHLGALSSMPRAADVQNL
jgi:ribokinase